MASYHLAPSLDALRDEINRRWPGRSKKSDGWIGDASHQASKSDHNPDWDNGGVVRAIDVTSQDIDADVIINALVKDSRVNYVIHRGRIYSRVRGFTPKRYTGANPHNHHVHVSIRHTAASASNTARWLPNSVEPIVPAKPPIPENEKDWFDMASEADLEKVVNAALDARLRPLRGSLDKQERVLADHTGKLDRIFATGRVTDDRVNVHYRASREQVVKAVQGLNIPAATVDELVGRLSTPGGAA